MSSASTGSRHGRGASRALIGGLLASLFVGLSGNATTSAAPAAAPGRGALVTGSPTASLLDLNDQMFARARAKKLRIGISPGFTILDATDAQLSNDLSRAKNLGANQLRVDISWDQIQPEPDVISWQKTDRLLAAAKGRGLNVLAVIGFAPAWGQNNDGSVKPEMFADFVDATARRYGSKVAAWEIWNEPNQTHRWNAPPSPAAYARLVEAASTPIRRHDPKAKILMGGLAPAVDDPDGVEISPITFLQGVYRANIKRSAYDMVSIHPFSYPALPSGDEEWNTFNRLPDIYGVMKSNGDGAKRMWLTEYGARTGTTSRSVSFSRQTRLVIDAYREAKKLPFVQALYFYSLRDYANDPRDSEANFGLLKFDGTPKPVYRALRRELRRN